MIIRGQRNKFWLLAKQIPDQATPKDREFVKDIKRIQKCAKQLWKKILNILKPNLGSCSNIMSFLASVAALLLPKYIKNFWSGSKIARQLLALEPFWSRMIIHISLQYVWVNQVLFRLYFDNCWRLRWPTKIKVIQFMKGVSHSEHLVGNRLHKQYFF